MGCFRWPRPISQSNELIERLIILVSIFSVAAPTALFAGKIDWASDGMPPRPNLMKVADAIDDDRSNCARLSGDAAIAACDRAIASRRFTGRLLADAYTDRCVEWYRKADYDRALADCNAAIRIDGTVGLAYVAKARTLLARKDADGALTSASEGVRLLPNSSYAYAIRGEVNRALGNRSEAKADYDKAISLNATGSTRQIALDGLTALAKIPATDPNDDRKKCDSLSGAAAIAACSRAIESGKFSGADLAEVYANRCFEWFARGNSDAGTPAGEWLVKLDYDRALADCNESIRINPSKSTAFTYKTRVLLAKKSLPEALAAADQLASKWPDDTYALAIRGQVLMAAGRRPDAYAAFTKALSLGAKGAAQTFAQAGVAELQEWSKNAKDNFEKCERLSLEPAIAACEKAIASGILNDKLRSEAYTKICFEYYNKADYKTALTDCDAAVKADSTLGYPHLYRALVLLAIKDANGALAATNVGLKILPDNDLAYAILGEVHRARNHPDEARASYAKSLSLKASGLALKLAKEGLASLTSTSTDPEKDANHCYVLTGELAIAACDRAIASGKLTGPLLLRTHLARCIGLFSQADYDRAQAGCGEAIRIDKNFWPARRYRAKALLKMQNANGAFAEATEAVRLAPNVWSVYVTRGNAEQALGRREDAKADFDKALSLDPDNAKREAEGGLLALDSKIDISYEPPANPRFKAIYLRLSRTEVLERVQQFLAPLRLPRRLEVKVAQCGAETLPYQAGKPVSICYELIDRLINTVNRNTEPGSSKRNQLILGLFIQSALREVGHAIFEMLQVPIWGREDDAVDRLAAFIATQFRLRLGTWVVDASEMLLLSDNAWTGADFANAQSPDAQRYFNYLCVVYGRDPVTYQYLEKKMPKSRKNKCFHEYNQVREAFDRRIMPYVDADLSVKVLAHGWVYVEDVQ